MWPRTALIPNEGYVELSLRESWLLLVSPVWIDRINGLRRLPYTALVRAQPVSNFPSLYSNIAEKVCMRKEWLLRRLDPVLRSRTHGVARECMQLPRCMHALFDRNGTVCIDRGMHFADHAACRLGTPGAGINNRPSVTSEPQQRPHRMDIGI